MNGAVATDSRAAAAQWSFLFSSYTRAPRTLRVACALRERCGQGIIGNFCFLFWPLRGASINSIRPTVDALMFFVRAASIPKVCSRNSMPKAMYTFMQIHQSKREHLAEICANNTTPSKTQFVASNLFYTKFQKYIILEHKQVATSGKSANLRLIDLMLSWGHVNPIRYRPLIVLSDPLIQLYNHELRQLFFSHRVVPPSLTVVKLWNGIIERVVLTSLLH